MLKRFLLFAGEDYYPLAGWNTFIDSYDSLDDAMGCIVKVEERQYTINGIEGEYEWYEIVDLVKGEPVEQGGHPYGGLWNIEEWKNRKETEEWEKNNE